MFTLQICIAMFTNDTVLFQMVDDKDISAYQISSYRNEQTIINEAKRVHIQANTFVCTKSLIKENNLPIGNSYSDR